MDEWPRISLCDVLNLFCDIDTLVIQASHLFGPPLQSLPFSMVPIRALDLHTSNPSDAEALALIVQLTSLHSLCLYGSGDVYSKFQPYVDIAPELKELGLTFEKCESFCAVVTVILNSQPLPIRQLESDGFMSNTLSMSYAGHPQVLDQYLRHGLWRSNSYIQ